MPPTRRQPAKNSGGPVKSEQTKVVIFGHSKVKRLARHTATFGPNQLFPNLNLRETEFNIRLIGIGGANRERMLQELPQLIAANPDIVVLEIGSNDLCDPTLHPSTLAKSLTAMADNLCHAGIKRVMVGQILNRKTPSEYSFPSHQWSNPKYAWARDIDSYNDRVNRTNIAIREEIKANQNSKISFWEHFGFWDPTRETLIDDGVHLSPHGMKLYANSLKWAILRARESM